MTSNTLARDGARSLGTDATTLAALLDAAQHLANDLQMEGSGEAKNGLFGVLTVAQSLADKLAADLNP